MQRVLSSVVGASNLDASTDFASLRPRNHPDAGDGVANCLQAAVQGHVHGGNDLRNANSAVAVTIPSRAVTDIRIT